MHSNKEVYLISQCIKLINMVKQYWMGVQYILLKLKWFKSEEGTLWCLFYKQDKLFKTTFMQLCIYDNYFQKTFDKPDIKL